MCAARWVCRNGLPRQIAARQELAVAARRRLTPRMRPPVVQQCMEREGICPRRVRLFSPPSQFLFPAASGRLVRRPACSRVMPYHANPPPVPTASPPRRGPHARRLPLPQHPPPVPGIAAVSCCRNAPSRFVAAVSFRCFEPVTQQYAVSALARPA